jgi:phosphate-selective porin OprO/OprP
LARIATLQGPGVRDSPDDPSDIENRIRELEGLGPAPSTTSAQENRSRAAVPDKPTVAWTGELQGDEVMLTQSPGNKQVLGDLENFSNLRRARLGAIGSLFANTIYRLEFDFAQQGRPTFLDVYGQLTDLAFVDNVRIGHFFEPFSISRLTSNRYQTFMERPLLDAFAPSRNLGVMAFSTYAEQRGCWQIGMFAADSNDDGEEQTDRGGTAVTGRLTFLPYWDEPSDGRYYMHVGGDFSYRRPAQQTARFGYWPGFRPGSFDNIVWPRWAETGLIAANDVQLYDVEWAWVMGPVHVQAEYAASLVNQIGGPALDFHAWYVEVGWFLTGESRPYLQEVGIFNRVTPFEPFFFNRTRRGLRAGLGAWQIAARIDDLKLNDRDIQGGRLLDVTFGLNWHLNPYTRFSFNYVHASLTRGAPGKTHGDLYGMRAQFEF